MRSILLQDFTDFELVIVDDGSRDGTADIVGDLSREDGRIRPLQQAAGGVVSALNHGLERCRAPLVARMDGDDRMLSGRLSAQVERLESSPELAAVSTRVVLEPTDSTLRPYVDWLNGLGTPERIANAMFVESPVCHPSVMFRTGVVRSLGAYRALPWPEDWDLWLRMHLAGHRLGQIPAHLHVWRDGPNRVTRTDPRCSTEALTQLRAHFLARWLPGRARIWGAGRDGKRLARALEAEGVRFTAFFDIDPKKIGGVRRGSVPVLGPADVGPPDETAPIVTAVGLPQARELIRGWLGARGYVEGKHFVCAA